MYTCSCYLCMYVCIQFMYTCILLHHLLFFHRESPEGDSIGSNTRSHLLSKRSILLSTHMHTLTQSPANLTSMTDGCSNPFTKTTADIVSTIQDGGKVTTSHVKRFLGDVFSPSGVRLAQLVAVAVDTNGHDHVSNSELTEVRKKYVSEILKTFEGDYR